MKKKRQTDAQIMKQRGQEYGPVGEQMKVIGKIQFELFKYCMDRNGGDPSRKSPSTSGGRFFHSNFTKVMIINILFY